MSISLAISHEEFVANMKEGLGIEGIHREVQGDGTSG
jgi:hypothetical protein